MSRKIEYVKEYDKYTTGFTDFGDSSFHNLYIIVFFGAFYLIELSSLMYLNTKNLIKYTELVKYAQSRSDRYRRKFKKTEKSFSRMILITTFIFIFLSILNIVSEVVTRYYLYKDIYYDPMVNIFRAFTYFAMTIHYLLDPFIYLLIDVNLKNILQSGQE